MSVFRRFGSDEIMWEFIPWDGEIIATGTVDRLSSHYVIFLSSLTRIDVSCITCSQFSSRILVERLVCYNLVPDL